jgi:hypothetical protein
MEEPGAPGAPGTQDTVDIVQKRDAMNREYNQFLVRLQRWEGGPGLIWG